MPENAVENMNVEELLLSNDPAERQKGYDLMNKQEGSDEVILQQESINPPPATVLNDSNTDTIATEQAANEQKNLVKILYRGQEVVKEDTDGFLGRKSLDDLKKAKLHADAHIDHVETELEAYRRRVAEYEATINDLKSKPQAAPQPETVDPAAVSVKKPVAPVFQNADPTYWTPEEATAHMQYLKDVDVFLGSINNSTNPKMQELEDTIKKMREEQSSRFGEIDRAKQAIQTEQAESNYWTGIESFRNTHPEFKKKNIPIKDLNHEVNKWGERLAIAAGYTLPHNPSQDDYSKWESTKISVMDKYLAGDESLKSTHLSPPEGYEEVFELVNLERSRNKLISEGILGEKATLHEVFLYNQDKDGRLDSSITALEKAARVKGAQTVLAVARHQQAENATTLPDNAGSKPMTLSQFSQQEIDEIIMAHPLVLQSNPELRAKKEMIMKLL